MAPIAVSSAVLNGVRFSVLNALTRLHQAPSPMLRILVGALLLVLTFAGGFAVASVKTVTLDVDGTPITVTTMRARVIDVVAENGFDRPPQDLARVYPTAGGPALRNGDVLIAAITSCTNTSNPGVLLAARHIAFHVTGAGKAEAVRAVFREPFDPNKYPAQLAHRGHDTVWFMDAAAARLLSAE